MENDARTNGYIAAKNIATILKQMPKSDEGTITIKQSRILVDSSGRKEDIPVTEYRLAIIEGLVVAKYDRALHYATYKMDNISILKAITAVDIAVLRRYLNLHSWAKLTAYLALGNRTVDTFHEIVAGKEIVYPAKDMAIHITPLRTLSSRLIPSWSVMFKAKLGSGIDTITIPYVMINTPSVLFSLLQHTRQTFKNYIEQYSGSAITINSQPTKVTDSVKKSLLTAIKMDVPISAAIGLET